MKLTNINFHQTMPPDASQLSRLLTSDVFGESLTKEEISQLTGIPTGKSSGKVEPHIAYATYMGLLTDDVQAGKHALKLTELGEEILKQDPAFAEDVTAMTCYLRMVSPFGGAPLWISIMGEILPAYAKAVPFEVVLDILKKDASASINLSPFYSSMGSEIFAPLGLLRHDGDTLQLVKHKYNSEMIYVYAYALFREWEQRYPEQEELTADQLNDFIMPACIGWKDSDLYSAMENMQEKGLVSFNRQLVPYTVTKHTHSDTLISRIYSELC